jgi:hypothetical protein
MESIRPDSKEKRRQVVARYRAANPEKIRTYEKSYAVKNRESRRSVRQAQHLKKTYKLTLEEVQQAWSSQDGKCGICQVKMLPSGRQACSVCVDHDHATGQFRELLCRKCNMALGMYETNRKGIDAYLHRHPKKEV